MRSVIIAAVDRKNGIGRGGSLPWHLPDDLNRFRRLTTGHYLVMGRKTFASIGRPLPGRTTIVLSRDPRFVAEGCLSAASLDEAARLASERGAGTLFVCGGAEVYAEALATADEMRLTKIEAEVAADTFFPSFDPGDWEELDSEYHAADSLHDYAFRFTRLVRRRARAA